MKKCNKINNSDKKNKEDIIIQIKNEIINGDFISFLFDILNDKKNNILSQNLLKIKKWNMLIINLLPLISFIIFDFLLRIW